MPTPAVESRSETAAKTAIQRPKPAGTSSRRGTFPGTRTVTPAVSTLLPPAAAMPAAPRREDEATTPGADEKKATEILDDLSGEERADLEAEGKAAEVQAGKGPAPQPAADVGKEADKEAETEEPKVEAEVEKEAEGEAKKGAAGKKAAGAAGAEGAAAESGPGSVAKYLAAKGAPALRRGTTLLRRLRKNEQTHDDAGEKLQQSEQAVVIPPSEGQSKSNRTQVAVVSAKPAPTADSGKAKRRLQDSLKASIPKTIEDVDNFKRDKKAQHIGADVLQVVQGDKSAVVGTFSAMEQTPPPAPIEQKPEDLPPEEKAPPTPVMNLGQGAIAPLRKEHTDVSRYTEEADAKLKEEGITQEQLDMVDSGDLAAAKEEKKGLQNTARTGPQEATKLAQQEATKVDADLKREEKSERDGIRSKRKEGLGATSQKQKGTKSALEKKREAVAAKINEIYKKAQDNVKKKLADLEIQAMKRFEDGNAEATTEFEDNVKRELDAYKDERYSGKLGWIKKGKDWLLGMDELPRVKQIFETNRNTFVTAVKTLVETITADNKRVIKECKDELKNARTDIKKYVDSLGPDLKAIGKKAAQEMDAKLDELDQFVNRKEKALEKKLADKQKAAIKAIDDKIAKMKEAMSGALSKLGKLLLMAAKKFFTWALQKFGYSLKDIEGIINKGAAVIKAIFTKPIQFVKNLVKAASTGFQNFGKNFLTHLKSAVFGWLTGSLQGIQLPATWDLKGITSVALQMLGLTWQNIRVKLVKVLGETAVKAMETGFTLVVTLVRDGPMAAWEKVKEMAGDIKQAFIDAVKDFIKVKIVQKAIEFVLSLIIPGAGIIRAIVGIYDTIVFFIQKAKQIAQMVGDFLGSIGTIAMGNIGAAAKALEKGLATGLTLVISFLARLLRLDGITAKIRAAIGKLRAKVDAMLDRVVGWIVDRARKLFQKQRGTKKADDVRRQAGRRVHEILGRQTSLEAANTAVRRVLRELRPVGLRALDIRPIEGGGFEINAEASPRTRVAKLVLKPVTVAISAKIKMSSGSPTEGLARPRGPGRYDFGEAIDFKDVKPEAAEAIGGTGKTAPLPPVPQPAGTPARKGSQPSAGVIVEPTSGSSTLEVLAWNTSAPERGHNVSHAERQFINWFEDRPGGWLQRVHSVHIEVDGRPVCKLCEKDLLSLRQRMRIRATNLPEQWLTWSGKAQSRSEQLESQVV